MLKLYHIAINLSIKNAKSPTNNRLVGKMEIIPETI